MHVFRDWLIYIKISYWFVYIKSALMVVGEWKNGIVCPMVNVPTLLVPQLQNYSQKSSVH